MEWLKRITAQINEQLARLSTSQKTAIALCAALVGGSLMWLVQYSTAPEMVPVLSQDLTLDDVDQITSALDSANVENEQRGSRVYVKSEDRQRAMMILNRAEALPEDTSMGFVELLADSDPFRPSSENERRALIALGGELARIIASADDIDQARVVIQDKVQRAIGAAQKIAPSASVYVKMARGRQMSQVNVEGLCRFVSGAVSGLTPHEVTVFDGATGRAWGMPDPEDMLGVGRLEERKKMENHLTEKVVDALQAIPGAVVAISVDLDASRTHSDETDYADAALQSEMTETTSTESARTPSESGVNPNVGVAINSGSGGDRSESEETITKFYEPKAKKTTHIEKAPWSILRATASVGLPRSFLVGIHRARFGDKVEASRLEEDKDFQMIRDEEIAKVRRQVQSILQADENDVAVNVFYDFSEDGSGFNERPLGEMAVASVAEGGAVNFAKEYGIHIGLFALALFSFFMMSRMVRKSTDLVKEMHPPKHTDGGEEDSEEPLEVGSGAVGQASVTEGLLMGQEVDEDTLRYSQLSQQVTSMINEDPRSAADLIRRWSEHSSR